jgi:CheY-like chemotaxis protein
MSVFGPFGKDEPGVAQAAGIRPTHLHPHHPWNHWQRAATGGPFKIKLNMNMKKRILIADDDSSIRNGLKKLLTRADYDVALAADGSQAVDRFFSEPIDLLVLDLNMPGKDGWAACENITRMNPYVPMIIMTGLPDQFPIASAAGAGALLEKPLDPEEFMNVVQDLLGEPRSNHWLRRRSWFSDARSVPATRFVASGAQRKCTMSARRVSCAPKLTVDC